MPHMESWAKAAAAAAVVAGCAHEPTPLSVGAPLAEVSQACAEITELFEECDTQYQRDCIGFDVGPVRLAKSTASSGTTCDRESYCTDLGNGLVLAGEIKEMVCKDP